MPHVPTQAPLLTTWRRHFQPPIQCKGKSLTFFSSFGLPHCHPAQGSAHNKAFDSVLYNNRIWMAFRRRCSLSCILQRN